LVGVCSRLAALALSFDRRPFVIVGPLAALSVKGADDDELDDRGGYGQVGERGPEARMCNRAR
jgi:hypothetical protein